MDQGLEAIKSEYVDKKKGFEVADLHFQIKHYFYLVCNYFVISKIYFFLNSLLS